MGRAIEDGFNQNILSKFTFQTYNRYISSQHIIAYIDATTLQTVWIVLKLHVPRINKYKWKESEIKPEIWGNPSAQLELQSRIHSTRKMRDLWSKMGALRFERQLDQTRQHLDKALCRFYSRSDWGLDICQIEFLKP